MINTPLKLLVTGDFSNGQEQRVLFEREKVNVKKIISTACWRSLLRQSEQAIPGELRYAVDAGLKGIGLVRYGTEFMPEGKVLIRHLKKQYLDNKSAL